MKSFISFIVCYALFVAHVRANCRGKRGVDEMATCDVVGEDGNITVTPYSKCESICCGGALSPMGVGVRCCGTEQNGQVSNDTQLCCSYGNEYKVYAKVYDNDFCCGLDRFDQTLYSDGMNCCNNPQNVPKTFNTRTEMCCEGNVSFVGSTAYGSCCGKEGYDRREASCPCNVGPALYGAGRNAGCCRSRYGRRMENYNQETEGCCEGSAYSLDHEFCCGNRVGDIKTQYCCNDKLNNKPADAGEGLLSCCQLDDGSQVGYDPESQICCDNRVQEVEEDDEAICCGNEVFSVSVSGDSCCVGADGNATAYDSRTQVCCGGNVGHGDGCCHNTPYFPGKQLCCHGTVGGHDYKWPSCCGATPFDAYTQTCCGTSVFENPKIPGPLPGMNQTSHFTRCCGDYADESTLAPYDYLHGICCGDAIHDVDADSFGTAECCGLGKIDSEAEICCDYVSAPRLYGDDTGCCGELAYDQTDSICCNGNIRSLGGVARENAVCCGDGCIDGAAYYCCAGRQYSKGSMTAADFDMMSCDFDVSEDGSEEPAMDQPSSPSAQKGGSSSPVAPPMGNDGSPAPSMGSDGSPAPSMGSDGSPAPSMGNDGSPAPSMGNDGSPAPSMGNDGSPAPSMGSDASPAPSMGMDSGASAGMSSMGHGSSSSSSSMMSAH